MALFFVATPTLSRLLEQAPMPEKVQKKSTEKQDEEKQASFSQLNLDVVFPSHFFDFTGNVFFVPDLYVVFLSLEKGFSTFTKPVYRLSYFEKLFEHHIAINAP